MKTRLLSLLFILLSVCGNLFAEVSFTTEADKAKATTDEDIIFRLTLNKPLKLDVSLPDVGNKIEGFRVVEFGTDKPEIIQDNIRLTKWYKLRADISGTYILPAVEIRFKDENNDEKTLTSSEIFIEIASPAANTVSGKSAEEPSDIRDIKDIERSSSIWILMIIGILLIMAAATVLMIRKLKKRKQKINVQSPKERALGAIEKIKTISCNDILESKKFAFTLSEIIRIYAEEIFHFPASDRTTEELHKSVDHYITDSEIKSSFMAILEDTDIIKFTDMTIETTKASTLIGKSMDFINATSPEEEKSKSEDIL